MCDGVVTCPLCGTLAKDENETACHNVGSQAFRTYQCSKCLSIITVIAGSTVGNYT